MSVAVYQPSPTNGRTRRTRANMDAIRLVIRNLLAAEHPMTVRQAFYRLVGMGTVAKTEQEYKSTVGRLLTEMRLSGEVSFGWIADNTRWMRKPQSFSSMEQALRRTAEAYRRSLWDTQQVYVEVWLEKDALAGVLYDVTEQWDVPLMVTRGYPSISYLHEAAEAIRYQERPAFIYYFGDYDPSGVDIPRNVEARLREFAPQAELHFDCVAVKRWQIADWNLPTRPTKRTDSRAKGFDGESVEVDAILPQDLRDLVKTCIEQHVDRRALNAQRVAEASERDDLQRIAAAFCEPPRHAPRG